MLRLLLLALGLCLPGCSPKSPSSASNASPPAPAEYQPADGDFVFQSLPHNPLIDTIEGSTGSPFSHCGIVVNRDGVWKVIEAIGPVKETALSNWIRQGRSGAYAAYRLRPPLSAKIPQIIAAAVRYEGRPYDIHYDMDDARIYCSELLWKAANDATGARLGKIQSLRELHWQPYEQVIRQIENGNLPLDREMITPRAVTEDPRLAQVFRERM